MAGKRLIGDDNSINSFDGKTDQIHGQYKAAAGDPVQTGQAIAPQIPFSRCVPGPLSLRQRIQVAMKIGGGGLYGNGEQQSTHDNDTQIGTSPAYSVTKDNTGN
tara:strand:+ start:217 stop:528 length:312 start_codon:yes stop_codon:yes gene_type:complete